MSTITKATTHIGAVRQTQATGMVAVCELLGITPEQYCWHQFRQYEKFVQMATHAYPQYRDMIRHSPMFRGFWNNEWMQRNEENFLPFAYDCKYNDDDMMQEYKFIHQAEKLYHDEEFYSSFEEIVRMISR